MKHAFWILALLLTSTLTAQTTQITVDFHDGRGPQRFVIPPVEAPDYKIQPGTGWNFDTPVTYSPQDAFINAMLNATLGSYESPYDGKPGPQDANGWPLGGRWGAKVWVERNPEDVTGTYKLIIKGKTTPSIGGASGGSRLTNLAYDEATNTTTADVEANHGTLYLRFDGEPGIKVKLLRPGHTSDAAVFTPRFKELVKKGGLNRYMDWGDTNNSLVVNWSDRAHPEDATLWRGVPIEWMIALSNECEVDLWYCEPFLANEDFSRQAAALINASLAPPLRYYVEKSNEVWNGIFKQNKQNRAEATERANAGDPKITWRGTATIQGYWEHFNYADKVANLKRLYGPRAQVVLAGHFGYGRGTTGVGFWTKKHLAFINEFYGDHKDFVDVIAIAPYYSLGSRASAQPITAEEYVRLVGQSNATNDEHFKAWVAIARDAGLPLFAYEGGSHDVKPLSRDEVLRAQLLPEFEEANYRYLDNFFRNGGSRFVWFVAIARNHDHTWGATDTLRNLETPKVKAVERAGQAYRWN